MLSPGRRPSEAGLLFRGGPHKRGARPPPCPAAGALSLAPPALAQGVTVLVLATKSDSEAVLPLSSPPHSPRVCRTHVHAGRARLRDRPANKARGAQLSSGPPQAISPDEIRRHCLPSSSPHWAGRQALAPPPPLLFSLPYPLL